MTVFCAVGHNAENQYFAIAKADDEVLASALRSYHRELLTNNKKISARLKNDHGIEMRYTRLF